MKRTESVQDLTSPSNYKFTTSSILFDPAFNKSTAFTVEEREKLKLRGLLPPKIETIEEQEKRCLTQLRQFSTPFEKYIYLMSLQGRNETLFYRLLTRNLTETMPIVYTPTVGEACQKFGSVWRFAQGMYLSIFQDKGSIAKILNNWTFEPDIIVVTDGSRILGLGDLGVNGMGIPIGKLSLYVAGAGFHPSKTLPVCLDVGTNNEKLLNDELYLGNKQKRVRGKEFFDFVEEFILAVKNKWPNCLIQFEDFSNDVSFKLLNDWRNKTLCFNDDIQGTGGVICAGVINAVKLTGIPIENHRFLFFGAGGAATGVAQCIQYVMMERTGLSKEETAKRFWMVDSKGLVTKNRGDTLDEHKLAFARDDVEEQQKTLLDVVRYVKPTAIIGLASIPGAFNETIIREMSEMNERPIIMALSNPTSQSECTAEEAYKYSDGRAIFASGSPFKPVVYKGKTFIPGQGNNMYIFPGLGLGAVVSCATKVTDGMIITAAKTLAALTTEEELQNGQVYPNLEKIRQISFEIAVEVAKCAEKEGLNRVTTDDWRKTVKEYIYEPTYAPILEEKITSNI